MRLSRTVSTPRFFSRSAVQPAQSWVDRPYSRKIVSNHMPSGHLSASTIAVITTVPMITRSHHGPFSTPSTFAPNGVATSRPAKMRVSASER
ncbi:hypothetical protein [Nonomuraea salmonea]|uniref:hypothetical protein n=1 Tax=Nonomuraea salmonea TaxID=46181 RepID=UPI002FE99666